MREVLPDHYRRWVRTAVALVAVAYIFICAAHVVEGQLSFWPPSLELWVLGVTGVSYGMLRSGHHRLAALFTLSIVWLEASSSFLLKGSVEVSSGLGLVALLVAAAMLLGARLALVFAVLSAIVAPLGAALGGSFGWGPGLQAGDAIYVTVLVVALVGSALMLSAFQQSLAAVMARSREEAHRSEALKDQLLHVQKLEAVGQLAGGVAHDFNNLLTAMGGYAEMMLEYEGDAEIREFGHELLEIHDRGAGLTRQLLAFARKEVSRPRPFDLAQVVRGTEKLVQRLATERVTVDLDAQGPLPILADPGQIEQILLNLATNARDAMPDGGVLRISVQAEDGEARLEVADSGTGMPPEIRDRIFEPFFTTKERGKGTGLGLSTVHGLVTESGGRIEVATQVGQGTTFTIRWPQHEGPIHDSHSDVRQSSFIDSEEGKGHVLLVEDDDQVHAVLRRVLQRGGYQVSSCSTGQDALQHMIQTNEPPDLLLTDLIMPGMTGAELASRLRTRYPDLPVLFISGYVDDALRHASYDPVEDLVLKPVSPTTLLRRVESKIRGRRSPRQAAGS